MDDNATDGNLMKIGGNSTDLHTDLNRYLNLSLYQIVSLHNSTYNQSPSDEVAGSSLLTWQVVLISLGAIVLIALTVAGNGLVLVSFRVEAKLQIISNYFLLSLAVADLMIGLVSMPLYTTLLILGEWPLGPIACDVWLCIDYTMSNASVANLLIICFDRFMSVKKPLNYRAWRTGRNVGVMIAIAWGVSFLLWTPWIISWPHIVGNRTVPENECYIQFLGEHNAATTKIVTLVTSVVAFYLPVTVMVILYFIVCLKTRRRFPEKLQAGSNLAIKTLIQQPVDLVFSFNSLENDKPEEISCKEKMLDCIGICCEMHDTDDELESSDLSVTHTSAYNYGQASHCYNIPPNRQTSSTRSCSTFLKKAFSPENVQNKHEGFPEIVECITTSFNERIPSPDHKNSPTHLKNLTDTKKLTFANNGVHNALTSNSTKCSDAGNSHLAHTPLVAATSNSSSSTSAAVDEKGDCSPILPRMHQQSESQTLRQNAIRQRKQQGHEKRQDSKAAKTLSAILLAFILTWSPYMLFTIINAFYKDVIPETLYKIGYWLCYLNSTVNPLCYALCNITFRQTFLRILRCKVKQKPAPFTNRAWRF